ncbi:MAG TPA: transglutaminase domain-containing protein, partial [Spirochaetota bacterium]|nr:transglutaminase domain-containing protein [Spirochaetota bacterium]
VGKQGGKTVALNSATCTTVASIPYPIKVEGEPGKYLTSSYSDPKDVQYLKDLSQKIIGDAKTLDAAMARIGYWVRNHVSYELGAPTDAIGVIKARRAFCVGYGEVMTELLRAAGIPARTLTCYVPPGCGWGFNDSGGMHAFVEFYYPGKGWLCSDPQSTLDYVDPFHIIESAYVSTIASDNRNYVVDYQEEPKNWPAFKAMSRGRYPRPVIVLSVRTRDGSYIYNAERASFKVFKPAVFGSYQTVGDVRGFKATFYSNSIFSFMQSGGRYASIIITDPEFIAKRYTETISVASDSCLFVKDVNLTGPGKYMVEGDFYENPNVRRIVVRGENDAPVSEKTVTVTVNGTPYDISTCKNGLVHVLANGNVSALTVDGVTHALAFDKNLVCRVPGKRPDGDAVGAFIRERKIDQAAGTHLLAACYDIAGALSVNAFDGVYLCSRGMEPKRLRIEAPGIAQCGGMEIGRDYWLLFERGNRYIRKNVRFTANGIRVLDAKPLEETYTLLEGALSKYLPMKAFYEYYDGMKTIVYTANRGRVYLSLPEGEYLFSDNDKGTDVQRIRFDRRELKRVYSPESQTLDEFIAVSRMLHPAGTMIAGSVIADGAKAAGGSIMLFNEERRSTVTATVNASGHYLFSGVDPGARNRLIYSGGGLFAAKTVIPQKGLVTKAVIDTAHGKSSTLKTYTVRRETHGSRTFHYRSAGSRALFLLVPYAAKGRPDVVAVPLSNGDETRLC